MGNSTILDKQTKNSKVKNSGDFFLLIWKIQLTLSMSRCIQYKYVIGTFIDDPNEELLALKS